jgi:hypothetical protein
MRTQDEEIAFHLQQAAASGELAKVASYGKPMEEDAAWHATPESLRMPFKILKNSGFVPPEVELMNERAALVKAVEQCADEAERKRLQLKLSDLSQRLTVRLESLRQSGTL